MSSVKVCTAEYMLSTDRGLEFAPNWLPRLVAERFVGSVKDGSVDRAPDPLPFIQADFSWTNTTPVSQHLHVGIHRASRSFVTTNPNTVAIDDAVSWEVAESPSAPRPSATYSGIGGRAQLTRPTNTEIQFAYLFGDRDDGVLNYEVGEVVPGFTLHFRYNCLYSTPGPWRVGEEPPPRFEAFCRWVRLRCWAAPLLGSV